MKKRYTLLLCITLLNLTSWSYAQSAECAAKFNYKVVSISGPSVTLQFNNNSYYAKPGEYKTSSWSFGDGTSSSDFSPKHSYAKPGTYRVCLNMSAYDSLKNTFCQSSFCDTIVVDTTKTPPPPSKCQSNFKYYITDTLNSLQVQFKDASTSSSKIKAWNWSFGDGSSSTLQNPSHVYAKAGSYTTCLIIVSDSNCKSNYCMPIKVGNTPPPSKCKAYFNFQYGTKNKMEVIFKDASSSGSKITKWDWSFGDGNGSTAINPSHVYTKPGTYNVCLRISADSCSDAYCVTVKVTNDSTPPPPKCSANFNFKINGDNSVNFSAAFKQTGTNYLWNFGDGQQANNPNEHHQYKPGTYTVCLIVSTEFKNDSGQVVKCEDKQCKSITIEKEPEPCGPCHGSFTYKMDSNKVAFGSITGIKNASYFWKFGDGGTSVDPNPVYTYKAKGSYKVCLSINQKMAGAEGDSCAITTCKMVKNAIKLGIAPTESTEQGLMIYPNPTDQSRFSATISAEKSSFKTLNVYNSVGALVSSIPAEKLQTGVNEVNTDENLSPGIYIVELVTAKGSYRQRLMVK